MKNIARILILACCLILASCNSARYVERLRQKIRIEKFDSIQLQGLTGALITLDATNQTGRNLSVESAQLTLKYDGTRAVTFQLREPVTLPKRYSGKIELGMQMKISNPFAAMGVWGQLQRRDTQHVTVSLEMSAKFGGFKKNILYEDVQLEQFLRTFALSLDDIWNIISE